MKKRYWVILLWGILAAGLLQAAETDTKQLLPQPHYGQIAQKMARLLSNTHLMQLPLDDTISHKAWTNLLNSFDFDHSFFLQEDIATFAHMQSNIDDAIKAGDVSFAYEVYQVFIKRLEDRYNFVTNTLAEGLSFEEEDYYQWKRKDVPWAANQAECDKLWRQRIKNELLTQIIARELDQENATNHNAVADNDFPETEAPPILTPEENITKRYLQFLQVMQDIDEESIMQRYLGAVAMAYDPHSDYMSPMRKEDFDIDMNLSLCGIGAQLRSEDGTAKIMEIIPGGPADRDKRPIRLVKDDKIIGVGQGDGPIEDIVHLPLNKTVRKIRGAKGSKVVLSVIPASDPLGTTTKLVDLIRDEVKLEEQAATGRVERVSLDNGNELKLGMIRLPAFYGTMDKQPSQPGFRSAAVDVAKIIANFNTQEVDGLVLDLRNNGGGSLREAINLTGLFIRSGPVVQVRETRRVAVLNVPRLEEAMAFRKPVLVLINRASASASEIVAGALQDYGRALIVGDSHSHGKGTVQTVMPLGSENFGSLKVTTASFYRINGASTQRKGVTSDLLVPSTFNGMEMGEDHIPDALSWTQIEKASNYIPVGDVRRFVPELKEASAQRLANNERYARYSTLIEHINDANARAKVPLQMEARRKLMQAEREMRKFEDDEIDKFLEGNSNGKEEKEDDLILQEAFYILADLVEISQNTQVPMEIEGEDPWSRLLRLLGGK